MEQFFRDNAQRYAAGKYVDDPELYRPYGLELIGPPLSVE